ncbi:coiled-coil-helix-coiled-coil-helix domain-containing protein 7 isoform X1 [Cervus canadensis]|uniref:coiled-coil-helix-coiled-coil-helix domain-containing protein 7 isoform X1 n=1 Tax=Cervus canadensis TaxID=1574408 RepID=UPI001C9E4932|nr:coiled-coil-helix-coiled-coil-helix domain-containing protein 7 isoform X1 [Cervus canadensis]XP_043339648.1 coiled-coil-helix-coiled-coil-helix domain-containing protein 7 isoform X1 [Cervus canadensis]XP_043339649.1 coiled-coil-helix-coiled-coil-helix domain-containing protein 7 isoform X1 [Cervus canadensis]
MPMVMRRLRDPDINPCLSESDASTRCMAENNYDKESCSSHFLKYKNCRKFWIVAVNQLGNAWLGILVHFRPSSVRQPREPSPDGNPVTPSLNFPSPAVTLGRSVKCSILKRKLNEVDWVWSAVTTPETAFMDGRLHQDQVCLTPETAGWPLWPPGPRQVTLRATRLCLCPGWSCCTAKCQVHV